MSTTSALLFDPTDPGLRRDPYPTYRRIREESPAWRSPHGCLVLRWVPGLHRPAPEPHAQLRQHRDRDPTRPACRPIRKPRARELVETQKNRSLLDVDPPEHTRLRSLINHAFTPPMVEATRPMIIEFVDRLIDDFDGSTVDLVADFGSMLPILVICRMMGIPEDERHEFLAIGNAVARSVDPDVGLADKLAANTRMHDYIARLVELRNTPIPVTT